MSACCCVVSLCRLSLSSGSVRGWRRAVVTTSSSLSWVDSARRRGRTSGKTRFVRRTVLPSPSHGAIHTSQKLCTLHAGVISQLCRGSDRLPALPVWDSPALQLENVRPVEVTSMEADYCGEQCGWELRYGKLQGQGLLANSLKSNDCNGLPVRPIYKPISCR